MKFYFSQRLTAANALRGFRVSGTRAPRVFMQTRGAAKSGSTGHVSWSDHVSSARHCAARQTTAVCISSLDTRPRLQRVYAEPGPGVLGGWSCLSLTIWGGHRIAYVMFGLN